jgi:hypothetical protein
MVQDIAVYFSKCHDWCLSKNCPSIATYYKEMNSPTCLADCPVGFTENSNDCVVMEMCHSTCATCNAKDNSAACLTCPTTTGLAYDAFATGVTSAACTLTTNNNAQFLITVNRNTALGPGTAGNPGNPGLTSVTYDENTANTQGTLLSSLMYTQKVIDFSTFTTNNAVTFNFDALPTYHQKVIVRARVFTECSTASSQDTTIKMTLDGSPNVVNNTLTTGI